MSPLTVIECGACHSAEVKGLLCDHCGEIQPRPGVDRFAALGLPRRWDLSTDELEARYRELSRRLHPDRFATAPPRSRVVSLQAATLLNEAYRTLRAPVARAEYLLNLEGVKVDDRAAVAEGFLLEMLELREELQEAQARGDEARRGALRAGVEARRARALEGVRDGFAAWDVTRERARLEAVRDRLAELRYYQRFLDAVDGAEEDP